MIDIVQKLRKRMTSHDLHYLPDALSQEAASEIEFLRVELTHCINELRSDNSQPIHRKRRAALAMRALPKIGGI